MDGFHSKQNVPRPRAGSDSDPSNPFNLISQKVLCLMDEELVSIKAIIRGNPFARGTVALSELRQRLYPEYTYDTSLKMHIKGRFGSALLFADCKETRNRVYLAEDAQDWRACDRANMCIRNYAQAVVVIVTIFAATSQNTYSIRTSNILKDWNHWLYQYTSCLSANDGNCCFDGLALSRTVRRAGQFCPKRGDFLHILRRAMRMSKEAAAF